MMFHNIKHYGTRLKPGQIAYFISRNLLERMEG